MNCGWKQDEENNYETGCEEMHCITEGTPSENKMRFCCYCGRPINEILFKVITDKERARMADEQKPLAAAPLHRLAVLRD